MLFKTIIRYHCTLIRTAIMKNKKLEIASAGEDVEKLGHLYIAGAAVVENIMKIPQKIKQNDHVIQQFFFGYISKRNGTDICITLFIAALFTIVQRWKPPQCETIQYKWINKTWYIHTKEYYYSA